ncbi:CapA family protein [bacterium]|nr:CapA family protein [bacterium]
MKESVNIIIGGDFAPIEKIDDHINIWGDSTQILKSADFSIINLELPITNATEKIDKIGPNLKLLPNRIKLLKDGDIKLVTLANNHISDYGFKGIEETITYCNANGIDSIGAGINIEEAQKIYYKTINQIRFSVLNFAENEFNAATKNSAGFNPIDIIDNFKALKEAKKKSDFTIVIIHGGHEHYKYPSPKMLKLYRFYAEEGADIVIGHHTHVASGYEIYKGIPIFYSLGNLFFPWKNRSNSWYLGFLLNLKFSLNSKKIDFELLPYSQNIDSPTIKLLKNEDKNLFLNSIYNINKVIFDENLLLKEWNLFIESKKKEYLQYSLIPQNFLRRVVNKLNLIKYFSLKMQKLLLLNLIRCESHHELLKDVLKESQND